jgi:hypothetical protein
MIFLGLWKAVTWLYLEMEALLVSPVGLKIRRNFNKHHLQSTIKSFFVLCSFSLLNEQKERKKNPVKSSQVKSLITNNEFCCAQRATALSKTGTFCGCGVAEAPPTYTQPDQPA